MSSCGGSMEPIGNFQRRKGEHVLVHRCLDCGLERFNRIAGDDDFDLMLALPSLTPLTSDEVKAQRLEQEVDEKCNKRQVA
jgi:RNHCP domain